MSREILDLWTISAMMIGNEIVCIKSAFAGSPLGLMATASPPAHQGAYAPCFWVFCFVYELARHKAEHPEARRLYAYQKGRENQKMGKVDPKLLEMAEVFHMPKAARIKYIILPAKMPALARLLNRKKGGGKK